MAAARCAVEHEQQAQVPHAPLRLNSPGEAALGEGGDERDLDEQADDGLDGSKACERVSQAYA